MIAIATIAVALACVSSSQTMRAFESITAPATIVELPYVWDANDRSWEEIDYTKGWMPARPSRESADALEAKRQAKFHRE